MSDGTEPLKPCPACNGTGTICDEYLGLYGGEPIWSWFDCDQCDAAWNTRAEIKETGDQE